MKTTKSLFKLTMAAFVLVGMLACAKDDVAVNESQLEVRGPFLGTEFQKVDIFSNLTIIVNRNGSSGTVGSSGRTNYTLVGEGEGNSREFGACETSLLLNVDPQTGYATGQIMYSFNNSGEILTFALTGYLSQDPKYPDSEMISRLINTNSSGSTYTSGPYGTGTTTLIGDVFNQMQRMNMFDISVRTQANVHL